MKQRLDDARVFPAHRIRNYPISAWFDDIIVPEAGRIIKIFATARLRKLYISELKYDIEELNFSEECALIEAEKGDFLQQVQFD